MKTERGFTVIELLIVIVVLAAASILFFVQKSNVTTAAQDSQRKTSINAMYYSLENVYYKQNSYYPRTIDETVLPSVDPALFTDPEGNKLGTSNSDYTYTATNCNDNNQCKSYTLTAKLKNEADYVKQSQHS